ncbi:hypothetical protein HY524_02200 [Candidatus Berkelbacteria bacterium]|nr:hypothetical protein [Candidatus Berkelbacteria bacterium]
MPESFQGRISSETLAEDEPTDRAVNLPASSIVAEVASPTDDPVSDFTDLSRLEELNSLETSDQIERRYGFRPESEKQYENASKVRDFLLETLKERPDAFQWLGQVHPALPLVLKLRYGLQRYCAYTQRQVAKKLSVQDNQTLIFKDTGLCLLGWPSKDYAYLDGRPERLRRLYDWRQQFAQQLTQLPDSWSPFFREIAHRLLDTPAAIVARTLNLDEKFVQRVRTAVERQEWTIKLPHSKERPAIFQAVLDAGQSDPTYIGPREAIILDVLKHSAAGIRLKEIAQRLSVQSGFVRSVIIAARSDFEHYPYFATQCSLLSPYPTVQGKQQLLALYTELRAALRANDRQAFTLLERTYLTMRAHNMQMSQVAAVLHLSPGRAYNELELLFLGAFAGSTNRGNVAQMASAATNQSAPVLLKPWSEHQAMAQQCDEVRRLTPLLEKESEGVPLPMFYFMLTKDLAKAARQVNASPKKFIRNPFVIIRQHINSDDRSEAVVMKTYFRLLHWGILTYCHADLYEFHDIPITGVSDASFFSSDDETVTG